MFEVMYSVAAFMLALLFPVPGLRMFTTAVPLDRLGVHDRIFRQSRGHETDFGNIVESGGIGSHGRELLFPTWLISINEPLFDFLNS